MFERDLFATFEHRIVKAAELVLEEVKMSAPAALKARCATLRQQALKEAKVSQSLSWLGGPFNEDNQAVIKQAVQAVLAALQKEQKEASRSFAPHVQEQVQPAYRVSHIG